MVSAIFTSITEAMSGFISTLGSGVNEMTALFWTVDNTGTSPVYSPTILGSLVAIVVAVSLGYFVFRLIIGLARLRG